MLYKYLSENVSDPVLEQETQKNLCDFEIQTDSPIQARRLGLIVVNGYVSDNGFQCARSLSKSRSKRNWKRDKYFDLTRYVVEYKNVCHSNRTTFAKD